MAVRKIDLDDPMERLLRSVQAITQVQDIFQRRKESNERINNRKLESVTRMWNEGFNSMDREEMSDIDAQRTLMATQRDELIRDYPQLSEEINSQYSVYETGFKKLDQDHTRFNTMVLKYENIFTDATPIIERLQSGPLSIAEQEELKGEVLEMFRGTAITQKNMSELQRKFPNLFDAQADQIATASWLMDTLEEGFGGVWDDYEISLLAAGKDQTFSANQLQNMWAPYQQSVKENYRDTKNNIDAKLDHSLINYKMYDDYLERFNKGMKANNVVGQFGIIGATTPAGEPIDEWLDNGDGTFTLSIQNQKGNLVQELTGKEDEIKKELESLVSLSGSDIRKFNEQFRINEREMMPDSAIKDWWDMGGRGGAPWGTFTGPWAHDVDDDDETQVPSTIAPLGVSPAPSGPGIGPQPGPVIGPPLGPVVSPQPGPPIITPTPPTSTIASPNKLDWDALEPWEKDFLKSKGIGDFPAYSKAEEEASIPAFPANEEEWNKMKAPAKKVDTKKTLSLIEKKNQAEQKIKELEAEGKGSNYSAYYSGVHNDLKKRIKRLDKEISKSKLPRDFDSLWSNLDISKSGDKDLKISAKDRKIIKQYVGGWGYSRLTNAIRAYKQFPTDENKNYILEVIK